MMNQISKSICAVALGSVLLANSAEEQPLNLWQITYKAETSFDDGYTIEGVSKEFKGGFHFDNDTLYSLSGVIDPHSLCYSASQ